MRPPTEPASPPTPLQLLTLFLGVALVSIGGGLHAHARRALLARAWVTEASFAEAFTLAQLTPGPNGVNLAAILGAQLAGPRGAAGAVIGLLIPGTVAMSVATAFTLQLPGGLPPLLQSALIGAACAALGVMATAVVPLVKVGAGLRGGPVLMGFTLLALGALRLDLLPVLLVVLAVGVILNRPARHE